MKNEKFSAYFSIILSLLVITLLMISGCGQTSTQTGTGSGTTETITIKGSLYTGSIKTSALTTQSEDGQTIRVLADSESPSKDQKVIAVGATSKEVIFADAKTGSDGSFSITVPKEKFKNESFYLEIIDEKNNFKAPVVFGSTTVGTEEKAVMAVKPGGESLDIGKIVYEAAKSVAVPGIESAKLDKDVVARLKSGKKFETVGTGANFGRGEGEAKYSGTVEDRVDCDYDGIPEVCDIDDDGDTKVDGLDDKPRATGVEEFKGSDYAHGTTFFTNLPLSYEEYSVEKYTTKIDPGLYTNFAIHLSTKQGVSPSVYSTVKIVDGPAWIETAQITGPDPLPSDKSWKNNDYKLYRRDSNNDFAVWVNPKNSANPPAAGQTIKFEATKTDASKENFLATLTFVFTDIPRLITFIEDAGSPQLIDFTIYQADSSFRHNINNRKSLGVIFTKPKDDQGKSLGSEQGMSWVLDGVNYYDSQGKVLYEQGSISISPTGISSLTASSILSQTAIDQIKQKAQELGFNLSDVLYVDFTPKTDITYDKFKIDIKAGSPVSGGGNAAHLVNFKKSS